MDDLVKRLLEPVIDPFFGPLIEPIKKEAADRIEQLEREKASWQGAYDGAVLALTERNKELEEALREKDNIAYIIDSHGMTHECFTIIYRENCSD